MTMYEAIKYTNRIYKIEVTRKTNSTAFMSGSNGHEIKRRIKSDTCPLFDTFEQAKQWLYDEQEKQVIHLRMQLERAKGLLGNIKGMIEK